MARILLIDDEQTVLDVFRQLLESAGHEVVTATDGQQGIDSYLLNPTDLIVTDMVMPVKDGLKMIMELIEHCPDVKIIAVSGGDVLEPQRYLTLAASMGIKETLIKPIAGADLLRAVTEALAG